MNNYFNNVQPYQHHTGDGINVYSFALHPEDYQPTGSLSLSRVDNAQLCLNFPQKEVKEVLSLKDTIFTQLLKNQVDIVNKRLPTDIIYQYADFMYKMINERKYTKKDNSKQSSLKDSALQTIYDNRICVDTLCTDLLIDFFKFFYAHYQEIDDNTIRIFARNYNLLYGGIAGLAYTT